MCMEAFGAALLFAEQRPHFQVVPFSLKTPFSPQDPSLSGHPQQQDSAPHSPCRQSQAAGTASSSHGGSQWEGEKTLPETFSRLFPFYSNLINVNMSLKTQALFINNPHFR